MLMAAWHGQGRQVLLLSAHVASAAAQAAKTLGARRANGCGVCLARVQTRPALFHGAGLRSSAMLRDAARQAAQIGTTAAQGRRSLPKRTQPSASSRRPHAARRRRGRLWRAPGQHASGVARGGACASRLGGAVQASAALPRA